MITIPTAEQEAFQSSAPKTLTLNFPFSDPITNEGIYMESSQLEQAICDESNLTFGMVYSSHFSVRIFDTGETYKGLRVNPVISVDADGTTYSRSLGNYTVKSDRLTSDKLYRDLECYDYLADVLSTDFTSWHNTFGGPILNPRTYTLKEYRDSFFYYIGLEQENVTLPNDNVLIRHFRTSDLSGASVISAILQMSGAFGYIGYDGKFKYVFPSRTPTVTISDNSFVQGSLNYEDEPMKKISGVKILGWEDEYGVAQKADKIVCDDWEVVKHRSQTLCRMYKDGLLKDSDIYANLSELIAGTKPGRENDNEFIYFSPRT